MKFKTYFVFVVLCLSFTLLWSAGRSDDEKAIEKLKDAFVQKFNAGDSDGLADFYTDDGDFMEAFSEAIKGKRNINDYWRKGKEKGMMDLILNTTKIEVSGDMAYQVGTYKLKQKAEPIKGNYLVVWKKQADGKWKIAASITAVN